MNTTQIIFELASTLCPEKLVELVKCAQELDSSFIEEQNNIISNSVKQIEENYIISKEIMKTAQTLETLQKTAGALDSLKKHGPGFAKVVGGTALTGVTLNLINDLVSHAHESVTRNRNFNKMMDYMPELKQYDQKEVKYIFDSLHMLGGPDITRDPVSSAHYVKNNVDLHGNTGNTKSIQELLGLKQNKERNRASFGDTNILKEKREQEKNNSNQAHNP